MVHKALHNLAPENLTNLISRHLVPYLLHFSQVLSSRDEMRATNVILNFLVAIFF